ncbi:hypothetical protein CRP902_gp06 [Roseobacter phage CRP-902]|jgi:hypothetical protein|nr:hypothetical protein CRP902_gp06 [Roseobacter phage CRP-902]
MSIRRMKYTKNGFDIICRVHGSGTEYAYADILYKKYGEDHYTYIGLIYYTTTAPCGTSRDTPTWHHVKGESPIMKTKWHEAAIKLYDAFCKKEAA